MAGIRPIRAWRYNKELGSKIEGLTSPLFDVVSAKQRKALYSNHYSSIHLSVPEGPNAAERASKILNQWKKNGTIVQDNIPGIYVYYQYYTLPGQNREYCRKGFICNVRTYRWEENVMLRHENTMPRSVYDRKEILKHTLLHASPTHGLYTDPEHKLEALMEESMQSPIYESEDYQGVLNLVSLIHDQEVINQFVSALENKQIILADGHHRYQGSLVYQQEMMSLNSKHTGQEGYNFHTIYLTNTEDVNFQILPTHRLIRDMEIDENELIKSLEEDFYINEITDIFSINEVILGKKWTFGLVFKDRAYRIKLKDEAYQKLTWNFPDEVKVLDLTVLHFFIIEKGLGIYRSHQLDSSNIEYNRSFTDCLTHVTDKKSKFAIIVNGVSIEDIKKVCISGSTMPPKSTYFYPKVTCGYVFSSIKDDEFELFPFTRV